MSKLVFFLKSRNLKLIWLPLLTAYLTLTLIKPGLSEVPIWLGVNTEPLLLIAFLSGASSIPLFISPNRELDKLVKQSTLQVFRLCWILTVIILLATTLSLFTYLFSSPHYMGIILRNYFLGFFLTTLAQICFSSKLAWLPATSYSLLVWLLGTNDSLATPRFWALTMYPDYSLTPLVFQGITAILTISVYTLRDATEV